MAARRRSHAMGDSQRNATTLRKTMRLEAFQDAVMAIAMTLPLTELVLPPIEQGGDLAGAFMENGPEYVAYLSSSLVIGLYWAHSHFAGKIIRATDHNYNLLSLVFLVAVSATSVPNTPFFDHVSDAANVRLAATIYGWTLAGPSVAWLVRWLYARRAGLVDPHLTTGYVRRSTWKYSGSAAGFVGAAVVTTFGLWQIGLSMTGLLLLSYLLPPIDPVYKAGEQPKSEIEEADERV